MEIIVLTVIIGIAGFVMGFGVRHIMATEQALEGCKFADPRRWKTDEIQTGRTRLREAIESLMAPDARISNWFDQLFYAARELCQSSGLETFQLGEIGIYYFGSEIITVRKGSEGISFSRCRVKTIRSDGGENTSMMYSVRDTHSPHLVYSEVGNPNDKAADAHVRYRLQKWLEEMLRQMPS